MSTFGERFKKLRLEKSFTQEELARDFNSKYNYSYNKSSISQYENNNRIPETEPLKAFADYFEVSVDYLLAKSDIKNLENKKTALQEKLVNTVIQTLIEKGVIKENEPITEEKMREIEKLLNMTAELHKMKNNI